MRPYRGKRKDNGEWVYGWYALEPNISDVILTESEEIHGLLIEVEVIPETVGQATGLHDKKKECYAGDVVAVKDGDGNARGFVLWNKKMGQWNWCCTEEDKALAIDIGRQIPLWKILDWQYRFRGEIIGNIHDDPKLEKN